MEETKHKSWKALPLRDKITYIISFIAFALGWIITIIGFFVEPVGMVSDSVLWILGQSLLFVGSVLGIAQYYNRSLNNFKEDIMNTLYKTKKKD